MHILLNYLLILYGSHRRKTEMGLISMDWGRFHCQYLNLWLIESNCCFLDIFLDIWKLFLEMYSIYKFFSHIHFYRIQFYVYSYFKKNLSFLLVFFLWHFVQQLYIVLVFTYMQEMFDWVEQMFVSCLYKG